MTVTGTVDDAEGPVLSFFSFWWDDKIHNGDRRC